MQWRKGTAFRTDPGAGQAIRVNAFQDPIDSLQVVQENLLFAGSPAWWIQVGAYENVSYRDYPYTGQTSTGGTQATFASSAGVGSLFVTLSSLFMDAGTPSFTGSGCLNPAGLGLLVLTGSAAGFVTRINTWHTAPLTTAKQVDLATTFPAQVRGGTDKYAVGYVCLHDTELLLHTRFSLNNSSAPSVQVAVVFSDLSYSATQSASVLRPPIRYVDRIVDIYNTGITVDGSGTPTYQGQLTSIPCKGGVLASVILWSAPAAGGVDLYMTSI